MLQARTLLATLLVFIAAGDSFWYTINGDTTTQFSLCRRLGFFSEVDYYAFMIAAGLAGYTEKRGQAAKQLQINKAEWVSFLKDERYGLSKETAEQTLKRFDVEALVNGVAQ